MSVFLDYAKYYDLLYKDKNYVAEVDHVVTLLKAFAPKARRILDLGCGTGRHAALLAERHFDVTGVDFSDRMLEQASQNCMKADKNFTGALRFFKGDVRSFRQNGTFDAVISLFHVFSYQTSNQDLVDFLRTSREHLDPGAIMVFDCWYGPAVLDQKPRVTVKRFENDFLSVVRVAEPHNRFSENIVDVDYQIFIKDKMAASLHELQEKHSMRYFFIPEVKFFMSQMGFEVLYAREWMTGEELSLSSWGACFVGRA